MTQTAKNSVLRPPQRQDSGEPTRTEDGVQRTDVSVTPCTINDLPSRSTTKADQLSTINNPSRQSPTKTDQLSTGLRISLLTGGGDKPYALGLATALTSEGVFLDFIGSDDLSVPELVNDPRVSFLNLRGDQRSGASLARKIGRVATYYWRLIRYVATAKPKVLHILWNNKFEFFDRTLLMLYYKCLGKKIVLTVHNVNIGRRDSNDTWVNRLSLRIQYRLSDHIFVHTEGMKSELVRDFGVREEKVSVIPFGINNTVPVTTLSIAQAKRQLGISGSDKTLLFFGNIAPYKGLEYLISALTELLNNDQRYRLIIVGKPKGSDEYWKQIHQGISRSGIRDRVNERIEYIPDEETELFFKAADVLVLPYTRIFQSGVLFLGYAFGLPTIAANVGPLKEEIIEGKTGFVFKPQDSSDLAKAIRQYFDSELFHNLENRRSEIRHYASERYSWDKVAEITKGLYRELHDPAGCRVKADKSSS
jgi:glycosyltransferase involved in cell wall biosynthesis